MNNGVPLKKLGSSHRRMVVVARRKEEWIEIPGATPRLIDEVVWQRVQQILSDPARIRRGRTKRAYQLRGRIKCALRGAAMVGQTLTVKAKEYSCYRCRHAYDRNSGRECEARYIQASRIESALWTEIKSVLSDPDRVLNEILERQRANETPAEVQILLQQLTKTVEREKRLLQLYLAGTLIEDVLNAEASEMQKERQTLERQLDALSKRRKIDHLAIDPEAIRVISTAVKVWLDDSGEAESQLALEVLQIEVKAISTEATIRGQIPVQVPGFITTEQTSA